MEDVKCFFRETQEAFTVYVVEQRFAVGRGYEYFSAFKGKENYISTNRSIKKRITKIIKWLHRNVPHVSELIEICFPASPIVGVSDAISALSKLFSVQEHQAVGPEVLDPIIIQEGEILQKYLNQVIALHKESILQPTIIILLKDNDFDRAKELLSDCPHGINIKMIRNSGDSEIFKVINKGATDIDSFLNAFSQQCFSTCSHTSRDILLNKEWAEDSLVREYSPLLLKIRSHLLCDDKRKTRDDIDVLLNAVQSANAKSLRDKNLMQSFECMVLLCKVFSYDDGGTELNRAYELAKSLNNDVLLAHVYRFSHFFPNISRKEKQELLYSAEGIFKKNNIQDHAIYCRNNALIHQFHSDAISIRDFRSMQQEATYNVPGLVGMSHIYNNTGVAHLLTGQPEEAIEYFTKGLDYAKYEVRSIQKHALMTNRLIAKKYAFQAIDEIEIRSVLNRIFDDPRSDEFPFLAITFVMNLLSIAYGLNVSLAKELTLQYPIQKLVNQALAANVLMGTGPLMHQMKYLEKQYNDFKMFGKTSFPAILSPVSGKRLSFIEKHGVNPFVFNVWL